MYAVGENFGFLVKDEEQTISVIGDMIICGKEYLIGENYDGEKFIFLYTENEEKLELIEDVDKADGILNDWEEEYYSGGLDIGDWEDDSYYDREDTFSDEPMEKELCFETDDDSESKEDIESFISKIMED